MTADSLLIGGFTKEFAEVFRELHENGDSWERSWTGGGTANSGWKRDQVAYRGETTFSEGIERFVFDASSGELRPGGTIAGDVVNPQYLTLHPTLPVLYATEYRACGRLLALALEPDGSHRRLAAIESFGRLAIAASVHPSGRFAYVAHWGDGTLTAVSLDAEGRPLDSEVVVRGDRDPESPHFSRHHQVRVTPTGNALLVTDVGRDELTVYGCDPAGVVSSAPIARIAFPPRSGPRHVEFHPSGRWVFVVTERASSLHVLEAENGIPTRIVGTYSTVPADFHGNNRPSELHLHPNGRFLYVGNRGFDSVTVFGVDEPAAIETLGYQTSFGRSLSCLTVDPTGQYLVAGNVIPGNVVVFRLDDDGKPRPVGDPVETPAPRSLVFS